MEQFEYTGKNMPVDIDLLVNHAMKLMKEYDDKTNDGVELHLLKSPYADKIQMQVDENTTIEIPSEIQNQAIQKWISLKGGDGVKSTGFKINNKYDQIKTNMDMQQLLKKEFEKMKKLEKQKKMKKRENSFGIIDFFFRLMIFVIITAMVIIAINFIKYGCNK